MSLIQLINNKALAEGANGHNDLEQFSEMVRHANGKRLVIFCSPEFARSNYLTEGGDTKSFSEEVLDDKSLQVIRTYLADQKDPFYNDEMGIMFFNNDMDLNVLQRESRGKQIAMIFDVVPSVVKIAGAVLDAGIRKSLSTVFSHKNYKCSLYTVTKNKKASPAMTDEDLINPYLIFNHPVKYMVDSLREEWDESHTDERKREQDLAKKSSDVDFEKAESDIQNRDTANQVSNWSTTVFQILASLADDKAASNAIIGEVNKLGGNTADKSKMINAAIDILEGKGLTRAGKGTIIAALKKFRGDMRSFKK